MRTIAITLLSVALCGITACKETSDSGSFAADGTGLGELFERDTLTIENDAGEGIEFDVYLALVHEQHLRGLMFVREMPMTTGMLFVYGRPDIRSIWMKNTYIPLDILFVRADGTIAAIDRSATPLTLDSRSSGEPVKYVIELNGGAAAHYNIGTNSRMIWSYDDSE